MIYNAFITLIEETHNSKTRPFAMQNFLFTINQYNLSMEAYNRIQHLALNFREDYRKALFTKVKVIVNYLHEFQQVVN